MLATSCSKKDPLPGSTKSGKWMAVISNSSSSDTLILNFISAKSGVAIMKVPSANNTQGNYATQTTNFKWEMCESKSTTNGMIDPNFMIVDSLGEYINRIYVVKSISSEQEVYTFTREDFCLFCWDNQLTLTLTRLP
ncbi:MAG: hypothetical protein RL660_2680 [Bacteroidota bacterium]